MAQPMEGIQLKEIVLSPQFFITVIAGILLALGFQFILTALSVAAGITAIGDVKKSYINRKSLYGDSPEEKDEHDLDSSGSSGVKVTTAFGVWSTLTVAISLFAATALAINLSLIAGTMVAITLALVIWSGFFLLLFYLEGKMMNSLVGGLIHTATAGLRSSASAVKNVFSSSEEQRYEKLADHTIEKAKTEFQNSFDPETIDQAIDEFFTRFDQKLPDYERVRKDIEDLVNESVEKSNQSREDSKPGKPNTAQWMTVQSVLSDVIENSSNSSKGDGGRAEQLKELKQELQNAYNDGDSNKERTQKAIANLTSMEEAEVDEKIERIKEFLSTQESGKMDADAIKQRINGIISESKVDARKFSDKLQELDRDSLVAAVSKNTSLERVEAEKYADKIEKIIRRLQLELNGEHDDTALADLKENLRSYLGDYLSGSKDSGVDFSALSGILKRKMTSKKEDLGGLKKNLESMDREQIIDLVTSNSRIDRKDIDKVVGKIETTKTRVLDELRKAEDTARGRLQKLERQATIKAEHARKTAASAAWWLVVSAVISAAAAIGGSMLTLF